MASLDGRTWSVIDGAGSLSTTEGEAQGFGQLLEGESRGGRGGGGVDDGREETVGRQVVVERGDGGGRDGMLRWLVRLFEISQGTWTLLGVEERGFLPVRRHFWGSLDSASPFSLWKMREDETKSLSKRRTADSVSQGRNQRKESKNKKKNKRKR